MKSLVLIVQGDDLADANLIAAAMGFVPAYGQSAFRVRVGAPLGSEIVRHVADPAALATHWGLRADVSAATEAAIITPSLVSASVAADATAAGHSLTQARVEAVAGAWIADFSTTLDNGAHFNAVLTAHGLCALHSDEI